MDLETINVIAIEGTFPTEQRREVPAHLSPRLRITYPATQPYESIDSAGKIAIFRVG